MGFYQDRILPRLMNLAMRNHRLLPYRERVIAGADGRVLEIGIGSGLNLPFYPPSVREVLGLDPAPQLIAMARRAGKETALSVSFLLGSAEAIPLGDATVDTVVTTWTLCSIPDAVPALHEIRRVLKPGGQLLFVEHGQAPEAGVRKWQDRLTPVWKRIAGGCHLNRPIRTLIESNGFAIMQLEVGYMKGPRPMTFLYEGRAKPASACGEARFSTTLCQTSDSPIDRSNSAPSLPTLADLTFQSLDTLGFAIELTHPRGVAEVNARSIHAGLAQKIRSHSPAIGLGLAGGVLVLAGLGLLLWYQAPGSARKMSYEGTKLDGVAPDFRLVNQNGASISLADFRGKVVVITLLDPDCTDICPIYAYHYRLAHQSLGEDAAEVVFLALNANDEKTSVNDVAAATKKWSLDGTPTWHFLTGSAEELRAVWEAYNVLASGPPKPDKPNEKQHSPAVFVIDRAGQRRWFLSTNFEDAPPLSALIVKHVRAILAEGPRE